MTATSYRVWEIDNRLVEKGWKLVSFGDLLEKSSETTEIDPLKTYKEITVHLWGQGVSLRGEKTGSEIGSTKRFIAHKGQFIFSRIDARNGAFGIIPEELEGAVVSTDFPVHNINEDRLAPKYLGWLSRVSSFFDACRAASEGTTNRVRLKEDKFYRIEIPLPPLSEQRRIVAKIERLSLQIKNAETVRNFSAKSLEAFWPSLLFDFLAGKYLKNYKYKKDAQTILFEGAEKHKNNHLENYNNANPANPIIIEKGPIELPTGWAWTTLGSVLTHLVDCINDTPNFTSDDTGLLGLKSTNIKPYKFDLSQSWFITPEDFTYWNRREKPIAGDIILTREAPMGHACKLPEGYKVCLTQRLLLLRPETDVVMVDFLLHFLNSPLFHSQVDDVCRGLTTPHIRVKDAPNFLFPLPPIEVQNVMLLTLNNFHKRIEDLKMRQNQTEAEIKAMLPSILDRAFKGEL